MRVSGWLVLVSAMLTSTSGIAQTPLPAKVQADLKIGEIEAAMAAGDATGALAKIDEYRKLGVAMPPALLFTEARLASLTRDYARSEKALSEYFGKPNIDRDKNYGAALAIYGPVKESARVQEAALTPEQRAQRDADRESKERSERRARENMEWCARMSSNFKEIESGLARGGGINEKVRANIRQGLANDKAFYNSQCMNNSE